MVAEREDAVKKAVRKDMARIRRRWQEYKAMYPHADPFLFIAEIIRTGRVPRVPKSPAA